MSWIYHQSTGQLVHNEKNIVKGYSGKGNGKNNPALESQRNVGPIPRGSYSIGHAHNSGTHGPHAMNLTPTGHNAHGRTGFMIHGDSTKHPSQASEGCVVLPLNVRLSISGSKDKILQVVR